MIATWHFPVTPPSLNETTRMHWAARQRLRKEWGFRILAVCGRSRPPAASRRRLEITIFRRQRLDTDNAYGSVKPLVDALVAARWLKDDSLAWLDLSVTQAVGQPSTRVVLTEPEPAVSKEA